MSVATVAEQGKKRVRVVVADDHLLYREGVVRALSASGQVDIVGEAADGRAALAAIQQHLPDVALQHLYEKLEVSDRAAAVANAMRRGLIE